MSNVGDARLDAGADPPERRSACGERLPQCARHLRGSSEEPGHDRGNLLIEQHEISHDHGVIAHLLECRVRAEPDTGSMDHPRLTRLGTRSRYAPLPITHTRSPTMPAATTTIGSGTLYRHRIANVTTAITAVGMS